MSTQAQIQNLPVAGWETAQQFLNALDPYGSFHFRSIVEAPIKSKSARKHDALDAVLKENRQDAGAFVMINEGQGDKNADITRVRAVFLDLDRKDFSSDDALEKAMRLAHEGRATKKEPIPVGWPHASVVVRSGGGCHLYWLVESCPVNRFKQVQKALARRFGGDLAVCNPARVMRLPGSLHWKSGEPVLVELIKCAPERCYALDDLLERLGANLEAESDPGQPEGADDDFVPTGRTCAAKAIQALRDALDRLDKRNPEAVHDRPTWLKVLMSIRAHDWGNIGWEIAEEWSRKSDKYNPEEFDKDWRSIRPEGRITPNTVYWLAGPDPDNDCPNPTTDDGMACRFRYWLGPDRVIHARGQFHIWAETHWKRDRAAVEALLKGHAKENADEVFIQYGYKPESEEGKAAIRAAKSLLGVTRQKHVLESLRVTARIDDDKLDADPMSLAVPNGIIDLRTGELLPSDPGAYCTLVAGVEYNPGAECPRFEQFLSEVFASDNQVIGFMQRWFGYCLTGSMREEKLLLGYGVGANGKSVLANILDHVMGDYAVTADPSILMTKSQNNGPSPELMRLAGKRLCFLNESKAGDRLDDGAVKKLVSTENIVARNPYELCVEFNPTAKLFIRSNHKPRTKDNTDGLWRRLALLPFTGSAEFRVGIPPFACEGGLGGMRAKRDKVLQAFAQQSECALQRPSL